MDDQKTTAKELTALRALRERVREWQTARRCITIDDRLLDWHHYAVAVALREADEAAAAKQEQEG